MTPQPKTYYSPEEYLELERQALYKSEYFNGEIFAMSGASRHHVVIVTNLVREFSNQLKKTPCQVYSTDLRVKVSPTGLYTYPDVIVLCDKPRFDDKQEDTLLNPAVIIEVLSESTKNYDRGEKFEHYRTLPSFTEYLLISQDKCHIEHFVKQADNSWLFRETNCLEDTVQLKSVPAELVLKEVYDKVEWLSATVQS